MPTRATVASMSDASRGTGRSTPSRATYTSSGSKPSRTSSMRVAACRRQRAPMKADTATGRDVGDPLECDVMDRDDERRVANRGNREAGRVDHVGLDVHARTAEPVPTLVTNAAVRWAEIDPRD